MPDRDALPCPHTDLHSDVHTDISGYVFIVQICPCGAARVLFPNEDPPRATDWCGERHRTLPDPTERIVRVEPTMEGD